MKIPFTLNLYVSPPGYLPVSHRDGDAIALGCCQSDPALDIPKSTRMVRVSAGNQRRGVIPDSVLLIEVLQIS